MQRSDVVAIMIGVITLLFAAIPGTLRAKSEVFQEITAPEVKHKLDSGEGLLIHVLTELEYDAQHIPNSINIPVVEMETTDKLPKDKGMPVIFYCMGKR